MAEEKRSLWSRLKNYANKHPVKAFLIGAAIVVGTAAFVVGTVLTAGALAGATGAVVAGVSAVATGAGAFAGAGATAAIAATVAVAGAVSVVTGAAFAAREIARGRMLSAWKASHASRLQQKYGIDQSVANQFSQLKSGINQYKKDVLAAKSGIAIDLQKLSNDRTRLRAQLASVNKRGVIGVLKKLLNNTRAGSTSLSMIEIERDLRYHQNSLKKFKYILREDTSVSLPPPSLVVQSSGKKAVSEPATQSQSRPWKPAAVNNATKSLILLEAKMAELNSQIEPSSPEQKIEIQKAIQMFTGAKTLLENMVSIEKNVAQFREIKEGLALLLGQQKPDNAALAQALVKQLKQYQQSIFPRLALPQIQSEIHVSVIDATGQRENVNQLIRGINEFIDRLETDYQLRAPAQINQSLAGVNFNTGNTTANLTKAMQYQVTQNPLLAIKQAMTIEQLVKPSVARMIEPKVISTVVPTPIVAEKKSVRQQEIAKSIVKKPFAEKIMPTLPEKPIVVKDKSVRQQIVQEKINEAVKSDGPGIVPGHRR